MSSVNCFRRVLLDVGGKKTIISVPHEMSETEVNKVMVVTRAYLQQYVYVEMILAECFIQKIEKSILKKKCVRFEVKKKWVDCKKNLRKVVKYYDAYVPNADFNNKFAMTFYDKISGDLYKLRDKIAVRLQNLGIGENREFMRMQSSFIISLTFVWALMRISSVSCLKNCTLT